MTRKTDNVGGRPTLFPGGQKRTINMSAEAFAKAEEDAAVLSESTGIRVSISQAIEAAVRSFMAKKFKHG